VAAEEYVLAKVGRFCRDHLKAEHLPIKFGESRGSRALSATWPTPITRGVFVSWLAMIVSPLAPPGSAKSAVLSSLPEFMAD